MRSGQKDGLHWTAYGSPLAKRYASGMLMKLNLLALTVLLSYSMLSFSEEEICIDDVCFVNSKNSGDIRENYESLVNNLNDNLTANLYFTDEMVKVYKRYPFDSFLKRFNWIKDESLTYIIRGDEHSAVLLRLSELDRYLIYYNMEKKKFVIGFDTPKGYEEIEKAWINTHSKPVIKE
jgi:hypothetical protein